VTMSSRKSRGVNPAGTVAGATVRDVVKPLLLMPHVQQERDE
jgi:hypothetical protein